MTTYLALLRAINVGGHQQVAMADLRDLLRQLGFRDPRSLLQTGNLVFGGQTRTTAALERRLETEAENDGTPGVQPDDPLRPSGRRDRRARPAERADPRSRANLAGDERKAMTGRRGA